MNQNIKKKREKLPKSLHLHQLIFISCLPTVFIGLHHLHQFIFISTVLTPVAASSTHRRRRRSSTVSRGGAGDCSSCVAVMLELARGLSHWAHGFRSSVIFLFNTGEEEGLNGAHSFITQHPWSETVRVAIDLEAMGVGGHDISGFFHGFGYVNVDFGFLFLTASKQQKDGWTSSLGD